MVRKRKDLGAQRQRETAFEALDKVMSPSNGPEQPSPTAQQGTEPPKPEPGTPVSTQETLARDKARTEVAIRITPKIKGEYTEQLDRHIETLKKNFGLKMTRQDALRNLIEANQDLLFETIRPKED